MEITNITSKTRLNSLIGRHPRAQFLQSYEWGEFQKSLGRKVWRLGVGMPADEAGDSAITVIKHDLPFGKSYLYIPRTTIEGEQMFARPQEELKNIARKENSIFIKIEPVNQLSIINYQLSKPVQPQTTLYLNLNHSEDALLQSMHPKTRYNIRLAEKHGVKVQESGSIDEFLTLNRETRARDKFRSHPDEYYKKMFETLNPQAPSIKHQAYCKLFTAYYQNKAIASNLIIFFADTATYLHGASSNEHRNLMAPHLLQWEVIKYAKSQGYKWYDFWGVNPSDKNLPNPKARFANLAFEGISNPSWQGITRFKRGFVSDVTGKEVTYPNCFDLPLSKFWYTIYRVVKLLKR